ncbi:hypothetical protein IEO21_09101 [Rhodonia placenta]|uniref:Uncharacterized protein n=1 Tax=Rhodonia placenta TaxID=104341 RepID=A0A8H7NV57_9APHY|nr:hypothetical protein IEO21_09101 [Postia placenta]
MTPIAPYVHPPPPSQLLHSRGWFRRSWSKRMRYWKSYTS